TYKAEVLHQSYRRRIRPRSHYTLGRLPLWARLASLAPRVTNQALSARVFAHAVRFATGMDQRRGLPRFAATSFRRWWRANAADRRTHGAPVLLWVDTFTNYFSPEIGVAAVRLLEDAGFRVTIPQRAGCCGLTWISTGQLDAAQRILRRTVAGLLPAVNADIPVVGLEPSCTATLRSDGLDLLDTPQAKRVASATRTLGELLSNVAGWEPPRLDGQPVVAQPHCHHSAVMGWDTDAALLRRAGAQLTRVAGCCGLAGNFGVERGHYEVSVVVAETGLLPAVRAAPEDALLLADGFSCRTQLADLADRRAVHLAQLLAPPPQ
ncbi:MAG TPA: heterodisulfide reductase-related iron-sulfur binding cluster, partial [Micromonosporaceae bacterium]|nr:heterodisulfide reductase-related iron-sulfur binding cluster [Micromonosporaceae bacterium]